MMDEKEFKALKKQIETKELNAAEREKLGGDFIKLSSGYTRYQMKGEGPACVLVHGYATPYNLYDRVFEALVNEGYKVLRYDLVGRGLSDRPKAKYTPEYFAKQLDEITDKLLPGESFILFGTSMGGTITTTFSALHPEKVKKLILLAPAGMDSFKAPVYMKLAAVPALGNLIFKIIGVQSSLGGCAKELHHQPQEVKDEFTRKFAVSAQYKGLGRCLLSSLKNTILKTEHATENYKKFAKTGIPCMVIWGTKDVTMPYYQIDRMKEVLPHAKFVTFEDSGHIFLYDEGDKTMKYVDEFIA